jgi:hypothetical protein
MKKYLLGATAAVAGMALALPAAVAQDEMMMEGVSLSGSIKTDIGFGSYDNGQMTADDLHFEHDATITFKASGVTDGGLTADARIDLKGKGDGVINAAHLTIGGPFGSLNFGHNGHASNMHGNKGIGGGYGGGGYYDCGETWTPGECGGPPGNDKGVGIRYSTPVIGPFQGGISFQPEAGATSQTGVDNDSNIIAVGANFSGDFAGTSVTLGAGMVSRDAGGGGGTTEDWGMGAAFAIGDTSLSLRYDNAGGADGAADTTSYGLGVDQSMGSLSFGIGVGVKNIPVAGSADTESTMISAGGTYDLGGGVSFSGVVNSGDYDAAGSDADMDDVGIGMRIALSF